MEQLYSLEPLGYPNFSITMTGEVWSHRRHRFIVKCLHRCGYHFVRIQDVNGKWHNVYVHRLLAKLFIPTFDTTQQIDHINGNKLDNRIENLRWVSNLENAHAAMHNGLMPHAVFMSDDVIHHICQALASGESMASISRRTGYPYTAIQAIRMRRNWCHISSQYTFPPTRIRTVLSDDEVRAACVMILQGKTDADIALILNTRTETIARIRDKRNFREISKEYF